MFMSEADEEGQAILFSLLPHLLHPAFRSVLLLPHAL